MILCFARTSDAARIAVLLFANPQFVRMKHGVGLTAPLPVQRRWSGCKERGCTHCDVAYRLPERAGFRSVGKRYDNAFGPLCR